MTSRFFTSTAIFALLAGPAFAQASGPGSAPFEIDGQITIGYDELRSGGLSADSQYYNVDLEGQIDLYEGLGIGFDAFVQGRFDGTDPLDRYSVYAFYEFSDGQQLRAGFVPSAVDILLIDDHLAFGHGSLGQFTRINEPLANLFAFADGDEPLAIGYSGDYGAIEAAATAHFNRSGDGEIYAFATTYTGVANGGLHYTLGAGLELIRSDSSLDGESFWLAAGVEYGALSADLVFADLANSFAGPVQSTTLATRYEIEQVDGLSVGLDYLYLSASGTNIWGAGLGAEYEHDSGFGARGSLQFLDDSGTDVTAAQVELFYRF
jgi:hypothetical protein